MFEEINILEFAMYLPLPYASAFFANLGAKVTKVEHPDGDPLKNLDSKVYNILNRKKNIEYLDIKDPSNKEKITELLKNSDIVLNGFKPSFLKKYGFDYDSIKEINPSIIYISLSAYEKNTPLANKAGHDLNFVGLSGIIYSPNDAPKPYKFQMADMAGALWAIIGAFYMLEKREKTGNGGFLDLSLFRSCLSFLPFFYFSSEEGWIDKGMLYGDYGCYNIYKCKDNKFIAVGSIEEKFFKRLLELLEIPYNTSNLYTHEGQKYYKKLLEEKFLSKEQEYWINFFENEDICVTPVFDKNEILKILKDWLGEENITNFILFPINIT